jgi:trehalose synthase
VFAEVPVGTKSLDAYRRAAGTHAIERCLDAAKDLAGARVLHLNATAFGGGVAELLYTLVPLMRSVGLDASWGVIPGNEGFYQVTKSIHNALQGMALDWTLEMQSQFIEHTRNMASEFSGDYDFVFVHDPQPVALLEILKEQGRDPAGRWIWRCHIDLTTTQEQVWEFLAGYVGGHDATVFTHADFAKELEIPIAIVPPSIDPRSPKNAAIHDATRLEVLERYAIDASRPMMCQVSRFDPWKDPLGVIDTYRLVKKEMPDLQLVMVASMAHDDPEGMHYLALTEERRNGDPDVFLLSNLQGVGNIEVNAFQRSASVVIQKSIREGFGLVVSEAMWKSKPVVGGNTGGIRLQIDEGVDGFLVDSIEQGAERVLTLLNDPALALRMGRAAKEKVRGNFLSPRHLADYLDLMSRLQP